MDNIDALLTKEQNKVIEMEQRLNEIAKEIESERKPAHDPTAGSGGKASSYVKIEKPKAPSFDLRPRNFSSFKKEFMSMVAVPGRPANDIGYQLKNAIPEKQRYLLANVDIDNYTEMMAILERKFGGSRKVVDSAVSDLEKLKTPATDRDFVRFVETIESIQRDLKALDLVGEIANASIMSKIEVRLPTLVKTEWAKKHVEGDYSDKLSTEVFDELMKFLEKNKRSAEYFASEVRADGSKNTSTCLLYTSPSPRD